jgi:glycine cleavage system H lipoate-binding protein
MRDQRFLVPEGFFFHQGHAWMQADNADISTVTIGMDDFAQKMVGAIDFVNAGGIGEKIKQGERGWTLRVRHKPIDMHSPVSGEIVGVNGAVMSNPSLINNDPYGKGWLLKVKADNIGQESKNLLSGNIARKWMEDVTESLLESMGTELGEVYQDGGMPVSGMALNIDLANWDKLVREFFLTYSITKATINIMNICTLYFLKSAAERVNIRSK